MNISRWFLLFLFFFLIQQCIAEEKGILADLHKTPQNTLFFLEQQQQQYQMIPGYKNNLTRQYLNYYFKPWQNPFSVVPYKDILQAEKQAVQEYERNPGWGENQQPHGLQWIKTIANNMHLTSFSNFNLKAIVINPTPLRYLPTQAPSFGDPKQAGQGYPFDNLQVSYLSANQLIYVVYTTKDKSWNLVITSLDAWGWVASKDIALASKHFVKNWEKQRHYVTPIADNYPILEINTNLYHFLSHIGDIYPLYKETSNTYEILVASKSSDGYAKIKIAKLSKNQTRNWPMLISSAHIARMANKFLGAPYGWGDINNYRDCSETMRDLFAPFAIWLPRNSYYQIKQGRYRSLAKYDGKDKQKFIMQNGIPFLTLLYLQGHIMLYIGAWHGVVYVFHTPWGIHTENLPLRVLGRDVIGRTVITPINLGQGYSNVPKTWLDKLQGLSILVKGQTINYTPTLTFKPKIRQ